LGGQGALQFLVRTARTKCLKGGPVACWDAAAKDRTIVKGELRGGGGFVSAIPAKWRVEKRGADRVEGVQKKEEKEFKRRSLSENQGTRLY